MVYFTKNQRVHYILQNCIHSDLLAPSLTHSTKRGYSVSYEDRVPPTMLKAAPGTPRALVQCTQGCGSSGASILLPPAQDT